MRKNAPPKTSLNFYFPGIAKYELKFVQSFKKTFMSEVVHTNRRKGSSSVLWGALIISTGEFLAVIPASPGDWHRKTVGGPFPTAAEASSCARAWMRSGSQPAHITASGETCHCARGVLLIRNEG